MGTIGPILSAKELAQAYQPLLLVDITLTDGTVLYFSTHPLSDTYGGTPTAGSYEYLGVEWQPRVLNQSIGAIQIMSDLGVGTSPQVAVVLADPDKQVYGYDISVGIKGGILRLRQVLWDAGNTLTGSFSSDNPALIKFVGTCGSPSFDESTITITATSLLNMTQMQVPPLQIQPLCLWTFPQALADRQSANTPHSQFFQCGYSPDQSGGVGNYESGTACFTSCDYSRSSCIDRLGDASKPVPILQDTTGRTTGRFSGMEWIPNQNSGLQRPYVTGKWEQIINATNDARYGDYVPMIYGIAWLQPEVMGVWSDGNYSRFEILICFGNCAEILQLVLNDELIPHVVGADGSDNDTGREAENFIYSQLTTTSFLNNYWRTINAGIDRNGFPNPNAGWGSLGDPYGGMAAIYVVALTELAPASAIPTVQILISGGSVRQYFTPTDFFDFFGGPSGDENSYQPTMSPVWVLMDLLIWANWTYDDFDLQSFIDAAAICETQIFFTRMDGTYTNVYAESGSAPYYRYQIGLAIRQRTAISELIKGIQNSMKAMLFFDYETGLLKLVIKQTLASQQSEPIPGSNYNTPVPSVTIEGATAYGYVAYAFDETNIIKTDANKSTLKVTQKSNQESTNKITVNFNNRENSYSQDSVTLVDAEAVARVGQEVFGSFPLYGTQTYDHTRRIINTWFSELYRGNPRLDYEGSFIGDTGGTMTFEWQTSMKAVHLEVGMICMLTDAQLGLGVPYATLIMYPDVVTEGYIQLIRITAIQPSTNGEIFTITAIWHNDNWYQDSYGQVNQPKYTNAQSGSGQSPFPWRPWGVGSLLTEAQGEIYFKDTEKTFQVQYVIQEDPGPGSLPYSQFAISGVLPLNQPLNTPRRPRLELIGLGETGGDSSWESDTGATSATFYCSIAANFETYPSIGVWQPNFLTWSAGMPLGDVSEPVPVLLSYPYNMPTFIVQDWPDNPAGYCVFAGRDPNSMTFQSFGTGTPFGVNLTATFQEASWGPPNRSAAALEVVKSQVLVSGVCDIVALTGSFSSGTSCLNLFMLDGVNMTPGAWTNRDVSFLGMSRVLLQGDNGFFNAKVLYNDDQNLYFEGSAVYDRLDFISSPGYPLFPNLDNKLTIRVSPTFGQDVIGYYFEDSSFVNELCPLVKTVRVTNTTNASPIVATVTDTSTMAVGTWVVLQTVQGNTAANGRWQISNISGNDITLFGSTGNGAYSGEGLVFIQQQGLVPNSLANHVAFIISGTGKGLRSTVLSNTATRIYISGSWGFIPDSTTRLIVVSSTVLFDDIIPIVCSNVTFTNIQTLNNFSGFPFRKTLFLAVKTLTAADVYSQSTLDPFREFYMNDFWNTDSSLTISVPGQLAIGTNLGNAISVASDSQIQYIQCTIGGGPVGAPVVVYIRMGIALLCEFTLQATHSGASATAFASTIGFVSYAPSNLFVDQNSRLPAWARLAGGMPITVDVAQIGTSTPGHDITVTIYYSPGL